MIDFDYDDMYDVSNLLEREGLKLKKVTYTHILCINIIGGPPYIYELYHIFRGGGGGASSVSDHPSFIYVIYLKKKKI